MWFGRERLAGTLFTLAILVAAATFAIIVVWGLWGFGGDTLVESISRRFEVSLGTAAAVVSCVVGLLGAFVWLSVNTGARDQGQRRWKDSVRD